MFNPKSIVLYSQPLFYSKFSLLKTRKSEDLNLHPNPRKRLIFQAFSHYQLCTLFNRTTLSTWLGSPTSNLFNTHCTRNGGTPIFALKWVCRTDTSVELLYFSYRQIVSKISNFVANTSTRQTEILLIQ